MTTHIRVDMENASIIRNNAKSKIATTTNLNAKTRPALGEVGNKVIPKVETKGKLVAPKITKNNLLKKPESNLPTYLKDTKLADKDKPQIVKKTNTNLEKENIVKKTSKIAVNIDKKKVFGRQESLFDINKVLLKKKQDEAKLIKQKSEGSYSTQLLHNAICDIDASDSSDPFMVSEYVQDIFKYLREKEKDLIVEIDFLNNHRSTPKMRLILIDWVVDVQISFKALPETLYLAISIIDRYLQVNENIGRENLQLVGATALFIASKYEEIYVHGLDEFLYICDNSFTKEQFLSMELDIVRKLDFKFSGPLPIQFLRRCNKIANSSQEIYQLGKYLLELSFINHKLSSIPPSLKAAAAFCLSMSLIKEVSNPATVWDYNLQYYTSYKYSDMKSVVIKLAECLNRVPNLKEQTIRSKYAGSKFLKISANSKLTGPLIAQLLRSAATAKQ